MVQTIQAKCNIYSTPQTLKKFFPINIQTTVAKCNLYLAFSAAIAISFLPQENVKGNSVPVIFKGHASAFHAFVISIVFTFTGAFTALMIGDDDSKTTAARFCSCYSMVAVASAFSILAYVVSLADPIRCPSFVQGFNLHG